MLLVLIVGGSLICVMIVGILVGLMIFLVMNKCKIDFVVVSGFFIIIINDIVSMFIYFGLVILFMLYLI